MKSVKCISSLSRQLGVELRQWFDFFLLVDRGDRLTDKLVLAER